MIKTGQSFDCESCLWIRDFALLRWDLKDGEHSIESKVFRTNPNSRDLKGWTCVCIAVFHDSRKVLQLLLEHGGDPLIKSTYNRNAWDLAKVLKASTGFLINKFSTLIRMNSMLRGKL